MNLSIDRRKFVAGAAALGAAGLVGASSIGRAAAWRGSWNEMVHLARARAALPYRPDGAVLAAFRAGEAVFLADAFRAPGDPGRFGAAAGIFAVGLGREGDGERPIFRELRSEGAAVLALLDCPSVSGAARLLLADGGREMRIAVHLFFRARVDELAIAPCSALVQAGSARGDAVREADAAAIEGEGRAVLRLLGETRRPALMRLPADRLRSFGLIPSPNEAPAGERPPSLRVEPDDAWGNGAVVLAETPATDDFRDNVSLAFVPGRTFAPGDGFAYRYRLHWTADSADFGISPRMS